MLNVLTPNGKKYEDDTRKVLYDISKKLGIDFCFFPVESPSFVDGFILKQDMLLSVFEAKFRNASFSDGSMVFQGKKYSDYLITATKIDDGIRIAKKNKLNYHIFVILADSQHLLSFKIYDFLKNETIKHKRTKTKTQFGANGGIANRVNVFIDIKLAKVIKY